MDLNYGLRPLLIIWIVIAATEARNSEAELAVLKEDYEFNAAYLATVPEPYEIVYPTLYRKNEELQDLTAMDPNRAKNPHFHRISLHLDMSGKKYRIKLTQNRALLLKGIIEKKSLDGQNHIIKESDIDSCYYQGYIKKLEYQTSMAVSTCDGLRGVLQFPNETFILEPLKEVPVGNETRYPHVVYKTASVFKGHSANHRGIWQSYRDLHKGEYLRTLKQNKNRRKKTVLTDTKYLELAVVMDSALFDKVNSSYSGTVDYVMGVANLIDSYYTPLNVQLVLRYVEVWNVIGQFEVSSNTRQTLTNFLRYKPKALAEVPHDAAIFISGSPFDLEESGMAVPESVCLDRAAAVVFDPDPQDPEKLASIMAHMIGVMLGIQPDKDGCGCEDWFGCIMSNTMLGSYRLSTRHFSNCSKESFRMSLMSGLGSCMFNKRSYELTFKQTCGNGIVERGEECDCGSSAECSIHDPCCERDLCMLRGWATCRNGPGMDCCNNCTVMPTNHVCRKAFTECDVPEFCDGVVGKCPSNALVQDGQPCRGGESHCYRGLCHTYSDQCAAIWGLDSVPAADECYNKFNPTGNFNGHCGHRAASGEYVKCQKGNVKCGLLHCSGGAKKPHIGFNNTFSSTQIVSSGIEFQCRIINGIIAPSLPPLGMVEDGTKCDKSHMCINHTCVHIGRLVNTQCVRDASNNTCSGHGVCTTAVRCFCNPGYGGDDCSLRINTTTAALTYPTTTQAIPFIELVTTWMTAMTTSPEEVLPSTTPVPYMPTRILSSASTLWLIIVLACVAAGAFILLGCCMLCYRRKSPASIKKYHKRKLFFNKAFIPQANKDSGSEASGPRLISFASNMPSYKAEKIKEFQRALRKSQGGTSETESEHSRGDNRESAEVQGSQTLPAPSNKTPPDKGILKKHPRSEDNLCDGGSRTRPGNSNRLSGGIHSADDILNAAKNQKLPNKKGGIDVGTQVDEDEDDYEDSSSVEKKDLLASDCEEEEINFSEDEPDGKTEDCYESDPITDSDTDDTVRRPLVKKAGSGGSSGESLNTASEKEKDKYKKIKNIDDLIRQIDEQFQHMSREGAKKREPGLSPANSSRSSETEVDRHYPRNSFYKQGDHDEKPLPPPHANFDSPITVAVPSPMLTSTPQQISPRIRGCPTKPLSYSMGGGSREGSPQRRKQSPPYQYPGRQTSPSRIPTRQYSPQRQVSPPRLASPVPLGSPKRTLPSVPPHPPQDFRRRHSPPKPITRRPTPPKRQSPARESPTRSVPSDREGLMSRGSPRAQRRLPSPPKQPTSPSTGEAPVVSPKSGEPAPFSAIPYRGGKNGSQSDSPPQIRRPVPPPILDTSLSSTSSSTTTPETTIARHPPILKPNPPLPKITNPLLDGYPLLRKSPAHDLQSNSEGYHSDRASEEAVIVREIPLSKPDNKQYSLPASSSFIKPSPSGDSIKSESINL